MQAFECKGLWMLPDADMPSVGGTLRVSSDGELQLSVIGSLGSRGGPGQAKEHRVILGTVEGPIGNQVTLTDCILVRSSFGSSLGVQEEYGAQRGFFGAHLSSPSDFTFRRMQMRVGALGPWAHPLTGLHHGQLGGTQGCDETPLIYYTTPTPVGGIIPGGEISLAIELTSSFTRQQHSFSERPVLSVTFDSALGDDEINNSFVYPLQNLMTFVSDRAQEVEEVSLWREDILALGETNPQIRLIAARVFPEIQDEKADSLHPTQLLFTLEEVSSEFALFIGRWFRLVTKYLDACNVYFGLQYGPPAYLDVNFIGVIEALCLYYTRTPTGILHRNQEEQRLKDILSKLSPADVDWVSSHIYSRPFPPLQEILSNLLNEHSEVMKPLLGPDPERLVDNITNTVSHIVRRDPEVALAASHGGDLYWMMRRLRILLRLCFLQELGFPPEKIVSFLGRNREYQHLST